MKSAENLYFGTMVDLSLDRYDFNRDFHIYISYFLHRTNCLFNWHFHLLVGGTTHDSEKKTQLHFAAESVVAVQLWKALADSSRHLGT